MPGNLALALAVLGCFQSSTLKNDLYSQFPGEISFIKLRQITSHLFLAS